MSTTNETNSRVIWTDDEWQQVVEYACRHRLETPAVSLAEVAQGGQAAFPPDRHRPSQSVATALPERMATHYRHVAEIADRLQREWDQTAQQVTSLRRELENRPDREAVLKALGPAEIVKRFGATVLRHVRPDELTRHLTREEILDALPFPVVAGYCVAQALSRLETAGAGVADLTKTLAGAGKKRG